MTDQGNGESNKPAPVEEAGECLQRIERLLETAVKELKQIRAIVAKVKQPTPPGESKDG